jgi:hypothetical protein
MRLVVIKLASVDQRQLPGEGRSGNKQFDRHSVEGRPISGFGIANEGSLVFI